ncbi:helix-turn-helix domain-containing protein [Micromonospora aurantiaca (nom. illeg.)]|uniref:helix-turn-helix domain-containing protein n=1 Tax=Micromonospora aurantiaca (nom. illeg.) TaxID=47850 RepID=UPI00342E4F27
MTETATLSEAIVAEIRAEMARQRRSGRAVAEAMGVTHIYLSRRLTGAVPLTVADLERVAQALNVSVLALLPTPASTAVPAA